MPNLPFLLAYVTSALHWRAWAIGVLAALPSICNLVQPPLSRLLMKRFSLHSIMRWGFIISALPWFLVGITYQIPSPVSHIVFGLLLATSTLANSVTSVAWSTAIAEIVPQRISGAYFGRRSLVFGCWTLISLLIAGKIVDFSENSPITYISIFAAAGMARLAGLFYLEKMKFPEKVTKPSTEEIRWSDLLLPLKDRNYRNYMLFIGVWGMLLNIGLPFYTVFMLRHLKFDVGKTIILSTIAALGGIITLRSWGQLVDHYGNKPAQYASALAWVIVGAIGWLLAEPGRTGHLYLVFLMIGGASAGFQLTQFNLMLRLTPHGKGPIYVATFLAVTSALTALGPILGGAFLAIMPNHLTAFSQHLLDYQLLFLLSFAACAACLPMLAGTHENEAKPVDQVWRRMWRMRSFNPLLAFTNVIGFLLTPRGVIALGQSSLRSLRREFKRVALVGKELKAARRAVP